MLTGITKMTWGMVLTATLIAVTLALMVVLSISGHSPDANLGDVEKVLLGAFVLQVTGNAVKNDKANGSGS